jgi:hypothetical protein
MAAEVTMMSVFAFEGSVVFGLAAAVLLGFAVALVLAVQRRRRLIPPDVQAHERRRAEITGDLSENTTVGWELAVALGVSAGIVLSLALVLLAVVNRL